MEQQTQETRQSFRQTRTVETRQQQVSFQTQGQVITSGQQSFAIQGGQNVQAGQGMLVQHPGLLPAGASPPVFEQIFRNARFAQGGHAVFEGVIRGNPTPTVSWTRKGAPLGASGKYQMHYEPNNGKVTLTISHIGPGDEGEYTCTAANQYGEAVCTVHIQPEAQWMRQQQVQPQVQYSQTRQEERRSMQQTVQQGQRVTSQSHVQKSVQHQYTNGAANGVPMEEDFKVDTFEYRLLRENEFRENVTRRYHGETETETEREESEQVSGPLFAPQVQMKPRNSKLLERSDATFQVRVPANPRPKINWFKNGVKLQQSQKYIMSYTNQIATLKIKNAMPEDAGHYTMLAENAAGRVVASAYLAVETVGMDEREDYHTRTIQQQQQIAKDHTEVQRMISLQEQAVEEEAKSLAPNFVRVSGDKEVQEGKIVRFECRITGRPYPTVSWYLNGHQVKDDATHKLLVNESGEHALMITNVSRNDVGTITCVGRNKSGEASFECKLHVIEKELVVAPKFVERFKAVQVKQGDTVSLHCRAVGTPAPKLTWQKDGAPIGPSQTANITVDGGSSTLEIPCAVAGDSAWYQCTAQNIAGSTATRARVVVQTDKPASKGVPWKLNLPRPTRVIEPEKPHEPEVIFLRHVERAHHETRREDDDYRSTQAPQFVIPLQDLQLTEGDRADFEAKLVPVGDPTMRIEWFFNGKALEASSRLNAIQRFGYVGLTMLSLTQKDSGTYTCRATNELGSAETTATLICSSRATIESQPQVPESWQQIQHMEDSSRYRRSVSIDESSTQKPQFIKPLRNLGDLLEGSYAHFEAQLTPLSDPFLRVEWFHNDQALTASSRISTIFNFGYVALNIMHLRPEDSGTYTVRATNKVGEAVSAASFQVVAKYGVVSESGIAEQQRYIDQIEQLETFQQKAATRHLEEQVEVTVAPHFKQELRDLPDTPEGGVAHFEARLEPVGDSSLRVEWYKDGKPLEASSRSMTFFNFGYVALTIKQLTVRDTGLYVCRAINAKGEATTQSRLVCISKDSVVKESQHPEGLERLQHLEDSSHYSRKEREELEVTQKPRFLGPLKGTTKVLEGQNAHFETRLEPVSDTTMTVEWYFNGKPIMVGSRVKLYHDFGYVALDILTVRTEDTGTYTVVARNKLGEEKSSITMEVKSRSTIDTSSMHHAGYEKATRLEQGKFVEPQYDIEEVCKSKPVFIKPLQDPAPVREGGNVHMECRLEPIGDPTMKVEWFHNGHALTIGSRIRTYFDFGYVALDLYGVSTSDTGEYTVRATNKLGSAHTSSMVRVVSDSDIKTETMHEDALEKIQYLEDSSRYQRHETEDTFMAQKPTFVKPLKNVETVEGTNVHLECRVRPVGDPSMRVEWFRNETPVPTGHRFRPAFDFDYIALDLLGVYPDDSAVYSCRVTNALGEAVTSAAVKVIAKSDLILETTHPEGMQKIQHLEDASRYKRQEWVEEVVNIKPTFLSQLKDQVNLKESMNAHFECRLEPVADSNLKVEWYKNGKPLTIGSRFRPLHDFGYVALDIMGVIPEDNGVYTCRATNQVGSDETTAKLSCKGGKTIMTDTVHETGMEKIRHLEDGSRYHRTEDVDEITTQPPVFTTSLKNISIKEGQRAHFECRLIPVSDATMKVQWFHNNVPVKSGARFTESNNFGFVALDIMYAYPEDSGSYTCKATNALGEAVTSCSLSVKGKRSIQMETHHEGALEQIQYLEQKETKEDHPDEMISQAPVFTQPMHSLTLKENQSAHFECRLIPVGDPKLKVEWYRNGVPLASAARIKTMHDFGYVALDLSYVYPEDSGTYDCKATNELGSAVTSATLNVISKASLLTETQHEEALEKLRHLEDTSKFARTEEVEADVTSPPMFITELNGITNLLEGQNTHLECRVEPYPDPTMKVEWFFNGKPLNVGHRYRTMNDFGFVALDILSCYPEDSGEYTVRATNKLGSKTSSIKIQVKPRSQLITDTQHPSAMEKIQYLESDKHRRVASEEMEITDKPVFGRSLKSLKLKEGQSAHLEATLTPVNDANMKVEWFYNGKSIPQGHRFKTTHDFGYVALDVLYCYPEDSGNYMCKATNANGEAVTTCSVTVEAKAGLLTETLDEQRLEKIRALENYEAPKPEEAAEEKMPPTFLIPLNNLENLKEGDHAHLETRLKPINDPTLKVEWFVNGKEIKTGHRFRTTHDFGYVALDILYTYAEDSGTYMCKATNDVGEAVNTCTISVAGRRSIYLDTQHPEGWEKIRQLECQDKAQRPEVEDHPAFPPRFTSQLQGSNKLMEGQAAHLEARVEPVHDPKLRIEFFHNGQPLPSGARYHTTFDFGYVALDIMGVYPEDAGTYTCKAINDLGEAVSETSFTVEGKSSLILESQRPEGMDKIRELEDQSKWQRPEHAETKTFQRPVFTVPLQNLEALNEGEIAHFECRLIPVGDPTLKVEWFRNEVPLETSSRISRTHDFGYVALDITSIRPDDEGVYICRASNNLGEAVTTASMKIKSKADIQLETAHPSGLKKIKELEEGKMPYMMEEPDKQYEKPVFTQPLTGNQDLVENDNAHFECRVVPVGDPTLRLEWYVNGKELKMGSRITTTHDFGFVTLDIMKVIPEDAGVYMCKAINRAGEAVTSTTFRVSPKGSVLAGTFHPKGLEKIKEAESLWGHAKAPDATEQAFQPPVFTRQLENHENLQEGTCVHIEATVEPAADPNLKVEWFKNGVQLMTGTRMRTTFDFGLVTMDISGLRAEDSGIYMAKATNKVGEAVSTCTLKIEDKGWLIGGAQRPEAIPKIHKLEEGRGVQKPEMPEPLYELPVFISHLNNLEVKEGESAHFECRVEPAKDPTLKIEFFVNGKPLPVASRFNPVHEFGYVALDITHTWPDDSAVYMCKATNSKGQASTSGTLRVISKADIYLDTQHPMGQAGLEKIQETEEEIAARAQKPSAGPEQTFKKPIFIVPLQPQNVLEEGQALHLEAQVEPKEDPKLEIEWFINGKALEHATRFTIRKDFGLVTLDLTGVAQRDSGIYTCRAKNEHGEAFTTCTLLVGEKGSLIESTQHPRGEAGLETIQKLEESLRQMEAAQHPDEEGHPPVFTSQFQNLDDLSEGDIAHFEATLTPVGDQTMRVEWFFNGKTIDMSHRIRTVHAFGMVVLEILGTYEKDSGTYTCRATNKWGQAEISVELKCSDKSRGQKPHFTTQIKNLVGLKDGDSAHFECTLIPVGDPTMKVEWFHNGTALRQSSRIKPVADFGFVVLDIAYTQSHDTGEYVCRATNKYGFDETRATIECKGKGGVFYDSLQPSSLEKIRSLEQGVEAAHMPPSSPHEPPVFHTQIQELSKLVEGQSAHFEARLTPTNDPNLKVEWYFNGKLLRTGHRFRTFHDFGIVILDILYCYEEDSGLYECRAVNQWGQDTTKTTLTCTSKASLILTPQIPKEMQSGLDKIQDLEEGMYPKKAISETEEKHQAPVFTVPFSNIEGLREGESAHMEARLTPTDDPQLKVEWFWNGKSIKIGSRFRSFCDFGFVILEISPIYPEDTGEYSARATNLYGEAVTTCTVKCEGRRSIILESQLPKSMQGGMSKIAELEAPRRVDGPKETEEGQPPVFLSTPGDLELAENSLAHFECRVQPVNDPTMKVEWFHNGKSLLTGSRIKTISDFGFVILELSGVYQRDSGVYTCKATNKHGEATVTCNLTVKGRQGIIAEPQLPTSFRSGTESIQKLEESLWKRDDVVQEDEKSQPPRFIVEMKDVPELVEGAPAHFDCRVEPASDPTMRIEWFRNGRSLDMGSRIHTHEDFGFIVLDLDWTFPRDTGEYVCRATNKWGSCITKASLSCKSKSHVILESQLPPGMTGEKLKDLEQRADAPAAKEEQPAGPPHFTEHIKSVFVGEGEHLHLEARVEPKTDPRLKIEWFHNGKSLKIGHRFRTLYDFGYISLDILYTYPEDSGEYVCRASNNFGEDFTKATINCKGVAGIQLDSQIPKGMKKTETLIQMEAAIKKYTSDIHLTEEDLYDAEKKQPPRFVTQIESKTDLKEMEFTKFECQLAPVGDPKMKVEWFFNGRPLPFKNRFTPIYDFGYVALHFGWVYPEDSGEYVCRATNLYGMDETRAFIKTTGRPGIVYDSQVPKGMESWQKIQEMEAAWQRVPEEGEEGERKREPPQFVLKPESTTVIEGEWARFVCRVTGFPRPRVLWVINGNTATTGSRYKITYDGMWQLDIPKTRQYDHGRVTVIAKNALGEAVAVCDLTVKPRINDYRSVLKNSPKPWYDFELRGYQDERQQSEELNRVFKERSAAHSAGGGERPILHPAERTSSYKPQEPEWQKQVRGRKNEDYYSKLKELEESQVLKEERSREHSQPFGLPGQQRSMAKGLAEDYESKLEQEKHEQVDQQQHQGHRKVPTEPSESRVHGKEVHTNVQKQTQKETKGDLEITRKITATETTEMEHKGVTQERKVEGPAKPATPPVFTKKMQPARAVEGGQARFEVTFDGDPRPEVKWYREDFLIKSSPEFQIHTFGDKSILMIREVFVEDSGVFAAIAENRGGSAKCSANLVVEEKKSKRSGAVPPAFASTIQDVNVNEGQLARLDARVEGTQPIDVYWLKNGRKLKSDMRYKMVQEGSTYTLLILETFSEDIGTYECVVINQSGEARCQAQIAVKGSQKSVTKTSESSSASATTQEMSPPKIVEPLEAQLVMEGQPAVFRCRLSAHPEPTLKWFKDEKQIKPSKYFRMATEGNLYSLFISEAFPEDEGKYKLIATNSAGTLTLSAPLKVIVPEGGDSGPIMSTLGDVNVLEGQPAKFSTQVTGIPQPTVQWFREGALIPQSRDFMMSMDGNRATLFIKMTYPEDSGRYTCKATNPEGQAESSAILTVKSKT